MARWIFTQLPPFSLGALPNISSHSGCHQVPSALPSQSTNVQNPFLILYCHHRRSVTIMSRLLAVTGSPCMVLRDAHGLVSAQLGVLLSDKLDPDPSPKAPQPRLHQSPILAFTGLHALLPPPSRISTETPADPWVTPPHAHRLPAGVSSHPVPCAGTSFPWKVSGPPWPSSGHLSPHYLKPHLCSRPGLSPSSKLPATARRQLTYLFFYCLSLQYISSMEGPGEVYFLHPFPRGPEETRRFVEAIRGMSTGTKESISGAWKGLWPLVPR